MYKNNKVSVVIPCFNEETQISAVVNSLPNFIDFIVIVDDKSTDNTIEVCKELQKHNEKIVIIEHEINQGCGSAISSGYQWSRDNGADISVTMDGDNQMDSNDLEQIIDPIVAGEADFTKGNRLITGEAYKKIPYVRYFGNSILSLLTKIASGYWHIADSQSGYTAINSKMLRLINWNKMYKRYGHPNDRLVMLNVVNARVRDVEIMPVYDVGEKSGMKVRKVIFTISWLLVRRFFWRLKEKYIIRDFHPLVFFYFIGILFYFMTVILSSRLIYRWVLDGHVPPITSLATMFSFMSSSLFILFGMWFDMESNKHLK